MRCYSLIVLLFLPMVCDAQLPENVITTDTAVIGTAQAPTIEGGKLNMPDARKNANDLPALSDEFSNDEKIQSLLNTAAKNGKLAYVLQRAEHLKLPATVALIPMVESHYQTDAVSPKGATGAWQLMPETAKAYGLKTEERKNFILSTHTALQLLKQLHQQFGNWTLAFAAYNAGSTRLKKALCHCPQAKMRGVE